MKIRKGCSVLLIPLVTLLLSISPVGAVIFTQCPGDLDGDLVPDQFIPAGLPNAGQPNPDFDPNVVCMHVTGGDGFGVMADGRDMFHFSFGLADHTDPGFSINQVVEQLALNSRLPAPLIKLSQGQELYLTMTNVGMVMRPDLFDPHSIHWHGFPNAAPIFDGLPEPSPTANMGSSFTYYYNAAVPGTYFYHCHVEAAEHMQMGMIGNLWVYPAQDNGPPIQNSGRTFTKFAYNDGNGSTGYDVEYPIQLTGFDPVFHDASRDISTLPFAAMHDTYAMINGRGYPETINTAQPGDQAGDPDIKYNVEGFWAQRTHSLVTATAGQRVLLRVSNVSTTHLYAIATTLGVPMKVVGRGAALLRGPTGQDTSFEVNVLHVGGGQAFDVLVDTLGVAPGTYLLYATTLDNLSNGGGDPNHPPNDPGFPGEIRGGLMTEIVIN